MRYKQCFDGVWYAPRRKNYYMQCCECGVTHRMDFKLLKQGNGRIIMFRAFRLSKKKSADKK